MEALYDPIAPLVTFATKDKVIYMHEECTVESLTKLIRTASIHSTITLTYFIDIEEEYDVKIYIDEVVTLKAICRGRTLDAFNMCVFCVCCVFLA